jgi:hypothetical protein
MNEKWVNVLLAVGVFVLVSGIIALLDRLVAPFWPTQIAVFVFSAIGCGLIGSELASYYKHKAASWIGSIIGWGAIFGLFAFVFRERHSLLPIWYGVVWFCVAAIATKISILRDRQFMKDHGMDNSCPRCGAELKYKGEGLAGYTDTIGSSGRGTRTASYESIYKCRKCGYEGRRI